MVADSHALEQGGRLGRARRDDDVRAGAGERIGLGLPGRRRGRSRRRRACRRRLALARGRAAAAREREQGTRDEEPRSDVPRVLRRC